MPPEILEQNIGELVLEICHSLQAKGFPRVSVGALMRLIGVPNERAEPHDETFISLADLQTDTKNLEIMQSLHGSTIH
jgi:hypothetical protein